MKNPNPDQKTRIRENVVTNWTNKSVVIVTQKGCKHCEELLSNLDITSLPIHVLDIHDQKGYRLAIESHSKTTPVVVLMTADVPNKYLSIDNVSIKCILTEIFNHLK